MHAPLAVEEESVAALVERAGFHRLAARCFACLGRGGWWTLPHAAEVAGLSRPDASDGMRRLAALRVAESEPVPAARGRPALRYRLAPGAGAALRALAEERRREAEREVEALLALAERF